MLDYRRKAFTFLTFASTAIFIPIALAQTPQSQNVPLNNPKERMVVPTPPTEGTTTDGTNTPATVPGAGAQTMPSTISSENAAKDKHFWLDRGTGLTSAQKQLIFRSIANKPDTDNISKIKMHGVLGEMLPNSIAAQELPADVKANVPNINDLKYVKANNQVLLINPPNNTVAAVIVP
jgi:hypothetical protein